MPNLLDPGVSSNNNVLMANTSGAGYQWLDCDNNYRPVPGATGRSFSPEVSGRYAVILFQDPCRDTSECIEVTLPGSALDDRLKQDGFEVKLYPNPVLSQLHFEVVPKGRKVILLTDIFGKEIYSLSTEEGAGWIDMSPYSDGMYIMKFLLKDRVIERKIVVNK